MKVRTYNRAFTLIELLVVIAIIGALAAVGLPALRGFTKSNSMAAATRQMLDELAFARQRAIAERTTVYMVFLPDFYWGDTAFNLLPNAQKSFADQLLDRRYNSYALVSLGRVGDQPGRHTPRFLTSWRSLPEGIFIAPGKFNRTPPGWSIQIPDANLPNAYFNVDAFSYTNVLPFPLAESNAPPYISLPFIAFNHAGQLVTSAGKDEFIPLAQGSVFHPRVAGNPNKLDRVAVDMVETPPGNFTNAYNLIHIDALTGRSRVERQELK